MMLELTNSMRTPVSWPPPKSKKYNIKSNKKMSIHFGKLFQEQKQALSVCTIKKEKKSSSYV